MPSEPQKVPKSRLRDRVRDTLLSPTSSIRLPKFLTNDPQSPARYDGTPISPGYQSSRDATGAKEQWYFPPDKPSPKQQHAKRSKRVSKSRDSDPTTRSQNFQSSNFSETFTPRGSSSPEEYFPLSPKRSLDPVEETVPFTPLQIHDLRNEKRILYADVEIRSGVLYDLIQTLPSTWLTTPQIKESFIPLLRANRETTQVRAPTPNELRLIEGFLTHLPDVHIIPAKRFNRISPTWDTKTNLFLSDEIVDGFDRSTARTHAIYSIIILATLISEISLWIIHQLHHTVDIKVNDSGTIVQHCIFGGVLLLETHPEEDAQLAFVDLEGFAWNISAGWLLFKLAEGPGGMPFEKERMFQRRRSGVVKRVGGPGGTLEGFE